MSATVATPKQVHFLRSLLEERAETLGITDVEQYMADTAVARLTVADISKVIDKVKSIPKPRNPEHAHLPEGHVIVNKRQNWCGSCGHPVPIGTGFAVHTSEGWKNFHRKGECLNTDEVLANVEEGRYALPSATGNNDLDFFRVRVSHGRKEVLRVIGGHADQPIPFAQVRDVAERLGALTDAERHDAKALFGRELGVCGSCGRHLTDEASRARGLGPECARQG